MITVRFIFIFLSITQEYDVFWGVVWIWILNERRVWDR